MVGTGGNKCVCWSDGNGGGLDSDREVETTLLAVILRSGVDIFVEGIVEGIPVEVGVGTMEVGEGVGACEVN